MSYILENNVFEQYNPEIDKLEECVGRFDSEEFKDKFNNTQLSSVFNNKDYWNIRIINDQMGEFLKEVKKGTLVCNNSKLESIFEYYMNKSRHAVSKLSFNASDASDLKNHSDLEVEKKLYRNIVNFLHVFKLYTDKVQSEYIKMFRMFEERTMFLHHDEFSKNLICSDLDSSIFRQVLTQYMCLVDDATYICIHDLSVEKYKSVVKLDIFEASLDSLYTDIKEYDELRKENPGYVGAITGAGLNISSMYSEVLKLGNIVFFQVDRADFLARDNIFLKLAILHNRLNEFDNILLDSKSMTSLNQTFNTFMAFNNKVDYAKYNELGSALGVQGQEYFWSPVFCGIHIPNESLPEIGM